MPASLPACSPTRPLACSPACLLPCSLACSPVLACFGPGPFGILQGKVHALRDGEVDHDWPLLGFQTRRHGVLLGALGDRSDSGVCEINTPFTRASALQSSSRNCHPPPDLVLSKLVGLPTCLLLRRRVFCSQTPVGLHLKGSRTAPQDAAIF